MSDPELATKGPESDAMEDRGKTVPSLISTQDSEAQSGTSMGEHCVTDRPAPSDRQPSGEMSKMGDIDVYISKPADYPNTSAKLLLLLTAGTGVHSTNNQIQADMFAEQGFVVIMPDQFGGDPAPNSNKATLSSPVEPQSPSILERIKIGAAETAKSFMVDMWLARQTPEKVLPILLKVIETCKDVSTLPNLSQVARVIRPLFILTQCLEANNKAGVCRCRCLRRWYLLCRILLRRQVCGHARR